jgi:hypothetical protein
MTKELEEAIEGVLSALVLENMYRPSFTFGHIKTLHTAYEKYKESVPAETLVIRNFAALRGMINNINESIQESEGLSFTPAVTLKTDGYEFYIEFMDNVMWDSENNGWLPITEIELQVREGMRDILRSLSKISV